MVFFILAIIVLIAGIVLLSTAKPTKQQTSNLAEYKELIESASHYEKADYQKKYNKMQEYITDRTRAHKILGMIALVAAIVWFLMSVIAIVPTGYTGIKTTFGKVEDDTMSSGINFILPWQSVIKMDNRTQKVKIDTQAFSSDIQQVDISLSVNFNIDQETAQILYKTVGTNYYDNVMYPRVLENTKALFSQYTAESLVEKRDELSTKIADALAKNMRDYGITVVSVSVENIDFTDAFTDAVEAKQVAAQKKLTAETEQAQKTMEEEASAKRKIIAERAKAEQAVIAANADLEVVQIQAEASLYAGQREAEMNQRIAEALTPELINYYWIKQWNGELPSTMLDGNPNIMLTLESDK